jgi:hypothetical protein
MNNWTVRPALLLVLGLACFAPRTYSQEDGDKPESYSAVAMGTGGGVGGKTIQFDFSISRFTTDQEVAKYAKLLKAEGPDALRRELEKVDVGRLSPAGSVGNQIAIARKRKAGVDTIITVVTARVMSFAELFRSDRSVDYPFGFLQVKLNSNGPGTGTIIGAAKIRFDKKKGQYEIESYGNQHVKAVNVRFLK